MAKKSCPQAAKGVPIQSRHLGADTPERTREGGDRESLSTQGGMTLGPVSYLSTMNMRCPHRSLVCICGTWKIMYKKAASVQIGRKCGIRIQK